MFSNPASKNTLPLLSQQFFLLTVTSQILNDTQTRLAICHRRIEIMLLAVLIHGEAFKVDVSPWTKLRLDRAGDVDGTLHSKMSHPTLHHGELDCDNPGHFDGAAEADLAIALREVQISD